MTLFKVQVGQTHCSQGGASAGYWAPPSSPPANPGGFATVVPFACLRYLVQHFPFGLPKKRCVHIHACIHTQIYIHSHTQPSAAPHVPVPLPQTSLASLAALSDKYEEGKMLKDSVSPIDQEPLWQACHASTSTTLSALSTLALTPAMGKAQIHISLTDSTARTEAFHFPPVVQLYHRSLEIEVATNLDEPQTR